MAPGGITHRGYCGKTREVEGGGGSEKKGHKPKGGGLSKKKALKKWGGEGFDRRGEKIMENYQGEVGTRKPWKKSKAG